MKILIPIVLLTVVAIPLAFFIARFMNVGRGSEPECATKRALTDKLWPDPICPFCQAPECNCGAIHQGGGAWFKPTRRSER